MKTSLKSRDDEHELTPGNYLLTVLPSGHRLWNIEFLRSPTLRDTFDLLNAQSQLGWQDLPSRLIFAAACMGTKDRDLAPQGDGRRWLEAIKLLALQCDLDPAEQNEILTHLNECEECREDAPDR